MRTSRRPTRHDAAEPGHDQRALDNRGPSNPVLAFFLLFAACLLGMGSPAVGYAEGLRLEPGIPLVISADASEPVLRAAKDLQRDLEAILEAKSPIVRDEEVLAERPCILVSIGAQGPGGPEAHRVFVEERAGNPHLVAHGADMRGAIFALYTISEEVLGIPPLWIWASWEPAKRSSVFVPAATNLTYGAPAVRWRAWFPNDMDYYDPWTRLPASETEPIDARDAIYETMLRLKLNAVDVGGIMNASFTGISGAARRAANRGLVVLSTHTAPLGTRLEETRWNNYWSNVRKLPAPPMSLDHEDDLFAFLAHSVDTILDAGIETLWTVTLRGHGDVAFWERMDDAPETDAERAAAIERFVRRQWALLQDRAGPDALARVTMYNELSDYFLGGLLTWPEAPNLLWNFTAARRDHYPPEGLADVPLPPEQPLGYYMNLQFTSTGSHAAQGEGPWKMEDNFRAAQGLNEAPLALSVVNAGNIREFVMELAANAAMMWDMERYGSGEFLEAFAATYFGEERAGDIAALYERFYAAYWEQRAPDIGAFERQYIFHDLRYGRAMRDILRRLQRGETTDQPLGNGFADLSFYMIEPGHTGASTIREAMEQGTKAAITEWEAEVATAEQLLPDVSPEGQRFFEDNLLVQARFLLALNRSLHALCNAISPALDASARRDHAAEALEHFREARRALAHAEHGYFSSWYPRQAARDIFRFAEIEEGLVEVVGRAALFEDSVLPGHGNSGPNGTGDANGAGPSAWVRLDDFGNAEADARLAERDGWALEGDPEAFTIVTDPHDPANKVLHQHGGELTANTHAWLPLPEPTASRGTLFFRQLIGATDPTPSNRQSWQVGLNSAGMGVGGSWWDYSVRQEIDFSQHRAADDRSFARAIQPYAWLNFWFVADREAETLRIYRTAGNDLPGDDDLVSAGGFRESAEDLSILKLSRSATKRDWHAYFDDFHFAHGTRLDFPGWVEERVEADAGLPSSTVADSWEYEGVHHPFRVHVPDPDKTYEDAPTVLYLLNLPIPRLGTDSDEAIIADLLDEGLVVLEVDAAGLPDTSPELERALLHFFHGRSALVPRVTEGRVRPADRFTYWLPSGYRLERDIPFWNIQRHGVHGSLEWIKDIHNEQVVDRFGAAPVDTPEQLRGPGGQPLDYNLHLDIMYPSGTPDRAVPVIAHFATLSQRPASFRNADRPMDPLGWLLDGFAVVYVDHIYNPLARHENHGHFEPGYTMESRNGIAAGSAAIRFLRAHAGTYNLDDRIGALGHSKSSYTVVRIADPRHPEQDEHSRFEGFPEGSPEPQPWGDVSGRVDAAFASMGMGTRRTQYFSHHMAPIVVACGRHDHFNHWAVFPRLVAACEAADALHLALWMEDLGHDRPFGIDLASGMDRNLLIRKFFAQHLHPHGREDLEVLFVIPKDGQEGVSTYGMTRILTADEDLPENMEGLTAYSPISVRFARSIDRDTVTPEHMAVRVTDSGETVDGFWRASLQNSRFNFVPVPQLLPGTRYEVRVTPGVRDEAGRTLGEPIVRYFRTAD